MNLILSKIALPLAIFIGGIVGGIFLQQRVISREINVPACPDCNCPQPAASVQPFDVGKMKKIKGFNYAPEFNGNISVAGIDSTALQNMIEKAIDKSFAKSQRKGLFRK